MGTVVSSNCTHNIKSNTEGQKFMGSYDPKNNVYVNKYKKEHYKSIKVEFKKEYFADVLAPAAESKGMAVSVYIKEAIKEKLERESKG